MDGMLSLVAKPLLQDNPMTYNPLYATQATNQRKAAQRLNFKVNLSNGKSEKIDDSEKKFSWNDNQAAQSKESNSTKLATSLDIITKTEIYYEIAMNAFIDNVCIVVVEHCLLDELPIFFNHEVIGDMDDPVLSSLASESSVAQEERKQLTEKVETLTKGLHTCSQYEVDEPSNAAVPSDSGVFGTTTAENTTIKNNLSKPPLTFKGIFGGASVQTPATTSDLPRSPRIR